VKTIGFDTLSGESVRHIVFSIPTKIMREHVLFRWLMAHNTFVPLVRMHGFSSLQHLQQGFQKLLAVRQLSFKLG